MKEFLQNFNSVNEFNYSVHISEEFRFVYFNNPKCACTTIKASLNLACATALGQHLQYSNIAEIHNRSRNLLLTPAEIGYSRFLEILADTSYFKFCFIREPVRRIVSAFASKLSWKSESLVALNQRLGRADSAPVGFEEFIKALSSDDNVRDMDEHWRLQRRQVCFDFVCFDKVGLFENLDSDLTDVLRRLFGNEKQIFDVRQYFSGNVSNSNTLMQSLTEEIRTKIGRIFEDDLSMYAANSNVFKRAKARQRTMEGSAVKSAEHDPVTGAIRTTWESGLDSEVAYWRSWVETKGGRFPGDYASRTSADTQLQPHIVRYLPEGKRSISILDVGSGPLTIVGRKAPGVALDITAVDALADEYNKILDQHGINPIVRTQPCLTEKLSSKFECDKFDIAYARNTLDHSLDPLRAIAEMLSVVQNGGIVLTEHARNEGQTHKYAGLHQWNFDIQDGLFVLKGRNTRPINLVTSLASKARVVELTSTGHFVRLGLQKLIDGPVAVNLDSSEFLHGEI